MLSAGMLASSLTLLLSWLVLVSFYLFLSGSAAWRWLLSWGLCPPGVLGTTLVDLSSLCEDMRSMYAFAPGPPAISCFNAGPQPFWFAAAFSFLVCRFSSLVFAPAGAALYGLRLYSAICFFVIQNSFQYYIV